jgi:hypothetical protein
VLEQHGLESSVVRLEDAYFEIIDGPSPR